MTRRRAADGASPESLAGSAKVQDRQGTGQTNVQDRQGTSDRSSLIPASSVRGALGSIEFSDNELDELTQALDHRWPSVIRHRRELKPDHLPFPSEPVPWYRLACRQCGPSEIKPSRLLGYAAGDYYLQDAGSLLALAAIGADTSSLRGGLLIADLCASPGGKASALLEAIGDRGFLLANEPIRSRLPALAFNLARTGSDRYAISSCDPTELASRLGGVFDVVMVDAPCSGQALLSRRRQRASAMSEKQIRHSAARQNRILDAAVELLATGGRMVYSTCTFAEAENESQVQRLVQAKKVNHLPVDRLKSYQSSRPGCYRLWPHRHRCAGAFAALTEVIGGSLPATINQSGRRPVERTRKTSRRPAKVPDELQQWFGPWDGSLRIHPIGSIIVGWPSDVPAWVEDLATWGPELAHRTGQTWKPAHAAALRRGSVPWKLPHVDVDTEVAIRFVAGQPIPCQGSGWQIVRHEDRPLGWVKSNGSVGKNHLPAAARMELQASPSSTP